ncbi:MAG: chemotaxis protein CheW [Thermotoga sp.]|nr:MAG: chemotaxis protein CheW [Thermotoga sp.]
MADKKVVSFIVGKEEYAVDIMLITSIIEMEEITRLPNTPDFVEGVINLRGEVIPIISLRKKFGLGENEKNKKEERIIVVNIKSKDVGMVVDSVKEVLNLTEEQIEEPPSVVGGLKRTFLKGIAKQDDRLIVLIDAEKILTEDEMIKLKTNEN